MQQPPVRRRSDPEATIAIPKQIARMEPQPGRKRITLGFSVPQLRDSTVLGYQKSAVIVFDQTVDSVRRVWHSIELGWAWLPSPQAGHPSGPEIAPAIFI